MCRLSSLFFPLDKSLSLPPLSTSYIKCTPCSLSDEVTNFIPSKLPFESSPVIEVTPLSAKLLTEGEDVKKVVELMLDTKDYYLSYLPGDTIGILPENPEEEVDLLLKRLNLCNFTCKIDINEDSKKKKPIGFPPHLPPEGTAKFLFKKCLDLRAVVKKAFLRALIDFTSDGKECRRLEELCSKEGSGEYNSEILSKKCSIYEVLDAFPSCQPPLSLLLEHIPRLQPRPYSIASSPLESPGVLRIVFSVVMDVNGKRGLCSGWLYDLSSTFFDITSKLNSLDLDDSKTALKIPLYLRNPTKFRVPLNPEVPMIMIGPGTGVAPFLGFLDHRRKQISSLNEENIKKKARENWLLFGCRYPSRDEIYRETFVKYSTEGLCQYLVSYSRDSKNEAGNKYVQDLLKLHQKNIVDQLLTTDTHLYICGDGATMGKQILMTLVECIRSVRGITEEEAKAVVGDLEKEGKILKDIWI